jgi:hypothetical protein
MDVQCVQIVRGYVIFVHWNTQAYRSLCCTESFTRMYGSEISHFLTLYPVFTRVSPAVPRVVLCC